MDHAQYGAEQTQQRGKRGRAVEHPDVPAKVEDFAGGVVVDRLADRRGRLAPVADHVAEDASRWALVGLAELGGPFAVKFAGGEPFQEPVDEVPRDHPASAEPDPALQRVPQHHHRTKR